MIPQFTLKGGIRLMLLSIFLWIPCSAYSQSNSDSLKILVISGDTLVLTPIQHIRNCAGLVFINEANVEYGLILKEKLFDCQLIDSAWADMVYQYKQVVILKNTELSIVNGRLEKAEYKYEKEINRKKVWRKIAVPSLGLNVLLILLLI